MGQVCPASAPSQQYVPTNCQGVSTNTIYEKRKIETSQPCVESRLISRGASCTQDDIRRSFRKEKELQKMSPRSSNIPEGNEDDERLHTKHRHSSRSIQNSSTERYRPDGHDSLRNNEHRDKDRGGKKHRHHKQDDALQDVRDEFEQFEGTHHHETRKSHHNHKTHLLHQKGAVLHVESQDVAKREVSTRERNKHDHRHHHHHQKKVDRQANELKSADVHRKERDKSRLSPHVAYSSQNDHNAKISARKTHLPNNSQCIRSSEKSQKDWSNRMEADSSRSSMKAKQKDGKEKSARGGKGSQRTRKLEDPVYSLPPIMK